MTAPLEKATWRPRFSPIVAAAAVRTLARTAIHIPTKPVTAEQTAPAANEIAVAGPTARPSTIATTTAKTASTRYSRVRKAVAPSLIASAMARIFSFPASLPKTRRANSPANASARMPTISARIAI